MFNKLNDNHAIRQHLDPKAIDTNRAALGRSIQFFTQPQCN